MSDDNQFSSLSRHETNSVNIENLSSLDNSISTINSPLASSSPKQHNTCETTRTSKDTLRILNINFQSFKNKKALLHNLVESTETDIIIGTETWLNNSIHSSGIIPTDQYNIFRNDREGSKGGGVLIAVHNSIICSELFKNNNTELTAVKIHHNQRSIIISACYGPPSLQDMTHTEKICNDFVHLKTLAKHNSLWIAGDFNLPDINWNKMTIEDSPYPNHINKSFIDIVQDLFMEQIVDFPTRLDNTLDLVFTTHRSLVNKCKPQE